VHDGAAETTKVSFSIGGDFNEKDGRGEVSEAKRFDKSQNCIDPFSLG
jgi:hypothetical protein